MVRDARWQTRLIGDFSGDQICWFCQCAFMIIVASKCQISLMPHWWPWPGNYFSQEWKTRCRSSPILGPESRTQSGQFSSISLPHKHQKPKQTKTTLYLPLRCNCKMLCGGACCRADSTRINHAILEFKLSGLWHFIIEI